jgi:ABC-type transport system substrate-binding protein
VPTGVPGARQAACQSCQHDPGQAAALLDLIGRSARKPVVMAVAATEFDRRVAALVKAQLAEVGLPVKVKKVAPASILSSSARAGAQLYGFGWAADLPRMDPFLVGQPRELAGEEVERLMAQARSTGDQATRIRLYQQAEQAMLEDAAVAPVLQYRHSAALAPGVEGFDLTPWGTVDLSACSLANSAK